MKKYDVIIVGAGPAGLNCAKILSDSDMKVLVLEKNSIIGPKVCAGGLTGKDLKYLNLPDDIIDKKYNHMNVYVNEKMKILKDDDYFIYTVDRKNLGQWQLKQIKAKKITIKTNSKATEITKEYVILNNKEKAYYSYLVGADGSNSIVRKYLNLPIKKIGFGIQYIIPNDKIHKEVEFFFQPKYFFGWYAWIFPHKDYVSVGCCCDPNQFSAKELSSNFEKWLEEKRIDVKNARRECGLASYDYRGFKFGNIFLVGDAGGFVSGFTGEGIYPAFISGEEAAKMILDKNYKPKKIEEILRTKRINGLLAILSVKTGPFKTVFFYMGQHLLGYRYFSRKAIKYLG